jgi:hypothetical protein
MLRVILYIVLFYFIYYFIKNLIIGIKMFSNPQKYKNTKKSQKKEGNVTIDYIPKKKKRNDDDGEYVDYEEIK